MAIAVKPTFRTDAFIDGAFQPARTGARFVTENPATGQTLAEVAAGMRSTIHPEEDDLDHAPELGPERAGALRASNPSFRASPTVSGATRFQLKAVAIASQTGASSQ